MSRNAYFSARLTLRQSHWEMFLLSSSVGALGILHHAFRQASPTTPNDYLAFFVFASVLIVMGSLIIKFIRSVLIDTYLCPYWIEECGQVVKLHGDIPRGREDLATKKLLGGRHGYKLVSNPDNLFGCTMAATKS